MESSITTLLYRIAADAAVLVHFVWIAFVVTGAFFLRRYRRWRLVHLSAVLYSVAIELFSWVCPLTHLEHWLRGKAGRRSYEGDFIVHYLEKVIYLPAPQWLLVSLTVALLVVTLVLYFWPLRGSSFATESRRDAGSQDTRG